MGDRVSRLAALDGGRPAAHPSSEPVRHVPVTGSKENPLMGAPDRDRDRLIQAALAWDAMRAHAGAAEGSAESRQIAREVRSLLIAEMMADE